MDATKYHRRIYNLNRQMDLVRSAVNFHLDAVVDFPEEVVFQDALVEISEEYPAVVLTAISKHIQTKFLLRRITYIVELALDRVKRVPAPRVVPVKEVR